MGRRKRANTGSYELLSQAVVGEDAKLSTEVETMKQLIHDLRNPVGSVSMAVEMLLGPLNDALDSMPDDTAQRVESTLVALSESARQLRHLVSDLALASGQHKKDKPPQKDQLEAATSTVAGPVHTPHTGPVAIDELLRRLEILTVTRSSLPALLAVDSEPGLTVVAHGPELLRALSNLVENAIEASATADPGASPWTVEIRARRIETQAIIEITNRGAELPAQLVEWLSGQHEEVGPGTSKTDGGLHGLGLKCARRVAEDCGGVLEGDSAAGTTTMRLRLPAIAEASQAI